MSGKKSCEVAAVLKQGEQARKFTDDIYSREITDCYGRYRAVLADMSTIKNSAQNVTATLDTPAQEMFGAEGKKFFAEFNQIKDSLSSQVVEDKGKFISRELASLDEKLERADNQAEDIRAAIRHKDWYCDAEYAQAQQLVITYNNLRTERVNLERRTKKFLSDEGQKLSSMRADFSRLKNLSEQLAKMNVTAKKRKEADSFRKELKDALANVDGQNAEKFFHDEFAALQKNTSQAISLSDEALLSSFQKYYSAITDFQSRLTERIALWNKQKADAQELFAQMEREVAQNFNDPIDRYNEEKNAPLINLFDYLKTYGGKDLQAKYSDLRDRAAKLIAQEKFLESMAVMNSAIELGQAANQEALALQENMLKKLELAGAIQDVMDDLRYDTDLQIMNDNPNDGFKITCNIGDETIDFQRVDIDADGKIVVDVDHTEGKGANCSNAWNDISRRLNEVGIPLTEVRLANGNSVLHSQTLNNSAGQRAVSH